MKRSSIFLLFLLMLMPMAKGFAQYQANTIDSLLIELWPDYDQKSVLVLLTGTLAADARFPASITLPFPETGRINAVARIDSKDGLMKDDIISSPDPSGALSFITPDPKFRVEYYFPYIVKDNQRSFDFTWMAGLSVNKLQLRVQQPLSSASLHTEPAAENIVKDQDGFDYHNFPTRAVPAGQAFAVHVDYQMSAAQLSVERMPPQETAPQSPGAAAGSSTGLIINWPIAAIVLGSIIIVVALVWQIAVRLPSSHRVKSGDTGIEKKPRVNFCPNCGKPTDQEDIFCGKCGMKL